MILHARVYYLKLKIFTSAVRSTIEDFDQNSALQAACDTLPPRTLRPLLTGCTTYRIYMINWCIPPKPSDLSPWRIYSFHAQIELPSPPPPPPPPAPSCSNPCPHALKTPPSPHRLYDLQDALDKLMHFLPQLSEVVPLNNGFHSFRAQTD